MLTAVVDVLANHQGADRLVARAESLGNRHHVRDDAGNSGAAGAVEIAPPVPVVQIVAFACDRERIFVPQAAVEDVAHPPI